MNGFLASVLLKGRPVFDAHGEFSETGQGLNRDASRRGRLAEFPQLAGVGRGQIERMISHRNDPCCPFGAKCD